MLIRSIDVSEYRDNRPTGNRLTAHFCEGMNVISADRACLLELLPRLLLMRKTFAPCDEEYLAFSASVALNEQEEYNVAGCFIGADGYPRTLACCEGLDKTPRYVKLLRRQSDGDESCFFDPDDGAAHVNTLEQYRGLHVNTKYGRIGPFIGTAAFHRCLRSYIQGFKPFRLCEERDFSISISRKGHFFAIDGNGNERTSLSDCEQILLRYAAFLAHAEFWAGAEAMRDLHHTPKPLFITDFRDRLDESVNYDALLQRAQDTGRQVFLLDKRGV